MSETDSFWGSFPIPLNEEASEDGFELVNIVDVQDDFLRMISQTAQLAQQLEELTDARANQEVIKARAERDLDFLRRKILASHISKLAKTASPEVRDAFIYARAIEESLTESYDALEKEIEKAVRQIEKLTPRINKLRNRLQLLNTKADWMKQYLDYHKLQLRIEGKQI